MEVTHARRAVILSILQRQSEPMHATEITELLVDEHLKGNWPQASWAGAANCPYPLGTRQHLDAMAREGGPVEAVRNANGYRHYKVRQEALVKHAADALRLKAEGKTRKQIGAILGISSSRVARVLTDPTGADERLRKKRYCPGCGAPKKVAATTCPKCMEKKAETLLPPDTFLMIARRYEARTRCPVVFGVTPGLERVIRIGTARGVSEHRLHPNDTWEEALIDAGIDV